MARRSFVVSALAALAVSLVLTSCASMDRAAPASDPAGPDEIIEIATDLAVADVANALHALRTRSEELGGRIETSDRSGASAFVRVRVPSASIGSMRAELDVLDVDRTERESRLDASHTRADVGARLRSARATEERVLALLADRTATLADVLAAESELARIRTTIEQTETEQRVLVDRIEYASLDITLREHAPAWRDEPLAATGRALLGGVEAAWTILVGLLVVTAAASPAIAMFAMFAMLARALFRRLA